MTKSFYFIDKTRHSRHLDMRHTTLTSGSSFGGLSELLLVFCDANQIKPPPQLEKIKHLERFDYDTWREILTALDNTLQRPALGLEIAQHIKIKHLGVIGYLAQSSHNLAQALQRYYDFHRLIYDGNPLVINIEHDVLAIRWDFPKISTTQLTNEIAIALMYRFLTSFLHVDDITLKAVHFQHDRTPHALYYQKYFKCPVLFSQPYAQLCIAADLLHKPLLHADSTLQDLLLQQANALLTSLPKSTQLDQRLQHAILIAIQQHQCSIEWISQQLKVSIRQLQRHLQQQNMTYQQRVQQVKFMLAKQYLTDPYLTLHEIALLLGYSEQSAFQRAFKQWSGQTPQHWRSKK